MQFVAEFTTNHLGNLNLLFKMTEVASKIGCDYIKMQKKDVARFYSKEKLASKYDSPYGKTYQEYRETFEFGLEDFLLFDQKCRELNLKWFCTAQDLLSLEFLLSFDLDLYKIASINARDTHFLKDVASLIPKHKKIVLSVAGCTLKNIRKAVLIFRDYKVIINHCVAEYPCVDSNLRLGNLFVLKKEFNDPNVSIGYSGHEVGYQASLAAAQIGVDMIERHFCISRHSFAKHIDCSLEPSEFLEMMDLIKAGKLHCNLPAEAFKSEFGMSQGEKKFLTQSKHLCE